MCMPKRGHTHAHAKEGSYTCACQRGVIHMCMPKRGHTHAHAKEGSYTCACQRGVVHMCMPKRGHAHAHAKEGSYTCACQRGVIHTSCIPRSAHIEYILHNKGSYTHAHTTVSPYTCLHTNEDSYTLHIRTYSIPGQVHCPRRFTIFGCGFNDFISCSSAHSSSTALD